MLRHCLMARNNNNYNYYYYYFTASLCSAASSAACEWEFCNKSAHFFYQRHQSGRASARGSRPTLFLWRRTSQPRYPARGRRQGLPSLATSSRLNGRKRIHTYADTHESRGDLSLGPVIFFCFTGLSTYRTHPVCGTRRGLRRTAS